MDYQNKRRFLFRCDKCLQIISLDLEEESEISDVQEDKFLLECPCTGYYFPLRD
jgi:hypothetical protein